MKTRVYQVLNLEQAAGAFCVDRKVGDQWILTAVYGINDCQTAMDLAAMIAENGSEGWQLVLASYGEDDSPPA